MSQMIVGVRLNPKHVPQEVIDKITTDEIRAARARARSETAARYSAEYERLRQAERSRNSKNARECADIRRKLYRRRTPVGRLLSRIETAWATAFGMAVSWKEIGETIGLWVDERKEGKR